MTSKYKRRFRRKPNGKNQKNKSPHPYKIFCLRNQNLVNLGLPQTQLRHPHPPHTLFLSGDNKLHSPRYIPDSIPTNPIEQKWTHHNADRQKIVHTAPYLNRLFLHTKIFRKISHQVFQRNDAHQFYPCSALYSTI